MSPTSRSIDSNTNTCRANCCFNAKFQDMLPTTKFINLSIENLNEIRYSPFAVTETNFLSLNPALILLASQQSFKNRENLHTSSLVHSLLGLTQIPHRCHEYGLDDGANN